MTPPPPLPVELFPYQYKFSIIFSHTSRPYQHGTGLEQYDSSCDPFKNNTKIPFCHSLSSTTPILYFIHLLHWEHFIYWCNSYWSHPHLIVLCWLYILLAVAIIVAAVPAVHHDVPVTASMMTNIWLTLKQISPNITPAIVSSLLFPSHLLLEFHYEKTFCSNNHPSRIRHS